MKLANKLKNSWFKSSQLYFSEGEKSSNDAIDNFKKDLKENGSEYFTKLSECKCCDRHQKNRPCNITDYKVYDLNGPSKKKINACNKCNCACRHYSRQIAYEFSKSK